MNYFNYHNHQLYAEDVCVTNIVQQFGTPSYIYSRAAIEQQWQAFDQAASDIDHLICYAVKANSNIAVLNILARLGSGFDIVSSGELERVLAAGGDPQKIVFSGVGKTAAEMQRALELNILCFNIESAEELTCLQNVAKKINKKAAISIRINPDVDAKTHPYIATGLSENKFGIAIPEALELYQQAQEYSHIAIHGVDCHIGSQLTELAPFLEAVDKVLAVVDRLEKIGIRLQHVNMGGGLGICYYDENPPSPQEYVAALSSRLKNKKVKLLLEPGRAIVANAGILVTKVLYLKANDSKNFAIVDAGMNDLLRPALYQAYQDIKSVIERDGAKKNYDVVGPVCETADFLGNNRALCIAKDDLLAIFSAGAYGFAMSSNYNSRPRVAEIMVDGDQVFEVRRRETHQELFAHEKLLPTF